MRHERRFLDDPDARARDSGERVRTACEIEAVADWARQWLRVRGVPDAVQPMYATLAWFLYKLACQDGPASSKLPQAASLVRAWAAQKTDRAVLDAMCRELLGFAPGDESLPWL
jgi:hypothetical protein